MRLMTWCILDDRESRTETKGPVRTNVEERIKCVFARLLSWLNSWHAEGYKYLLNIHTLTSGRVFDMCVETDRGRVKKWRIIAKRKCFGRTGENIVINQKKKKIVGKELSDVPETSWGEKFNRERSRFYDLTFRVRAKRIWCNCSGTLVLSDSLNCFAYTEIIRIAPGWSHNTAHCTQPHLTKVSAYARTVV